jgi:succinate-semialdehyde dehydrogenase / glutarate-semialdehyde dehydrogenase
VGRSLMAQAAERVLRVSMELGGNAPFLVFEDADLDAAVDGAMTAKMRNVGESCVAANRFLVHRSIVEPFTEALSERMGALSIGRGTDEGVDVGPLIDRNAVDKVEGLVSEAVASGAQVRVGGAVPERPGCFYPPTVLANVPSGAAILKEEVFGPVAPVTTFSDEDEAVRLANQTPYGLVAYAYTRDVGRALRLADVIESGMLGVNRGVVSEPAAPFGGVKQSGLGKEGGAAGLDEYLTTRYVALEA